MKVFTITISLLITTPVFGQPDTITVNGRVLDIHRDPFGYLKFYPGTDSVAEGWIGFLDDIGKYFQAELLETKRYHIALTPMVTSDESKFATTLSESRVAFIIDYLAGKYHIPSEVMLTRDILHNVNPGAVEVKILDKPEDQFTKKQKRQIRREGKREKVDEDEYFKDSS